MSFKFSQHSIDAMRGVHPLLVMALNELIKTDDFKVLEGVRSRARQWELYKADVSTVIPGPKAKHLVSAEDGLGHAVDIEPWVGGRRVDTVLLTEETAAQFAWMLRALYEIGLRMSRIWEEQTGQKWHFRFGINWDRDKVILTDQGFDDWYHVEIVRGK